MSRPTAVATVGLFETPTEVDFGFIKLGMKESRTVSIIYSSEKKNIKNSQNQPLCFDFVPHPQNAVIMKKFNLNVEYLKGLKEEKEEKENVNSGESKGMRITWSPIVEGSIVSSLSFSVKNDSTLTFTVKIRGWGVKVWIFFCLFFIFYY